MQTLESMLPRSVRQRPRDGQRQKVYNAERPLKRQSKMLVNRRGLEKYVRRVLKHKWFKKNWPGIYSINPRSIRSDAHAHGWYAGGGVCAIQIPIDVWSLKESIVLHEIAHGLTEYKFGVNKCAWHGREFANIFASLIQHYMGSEAGRKLRAGYREHHVKWRSNGKGNA